MLFGTHWYSAQQIRGSGIHHSTYKSPSAPDVGFPVIRDHLRMISSVLWSVQLQITLHATSRARSVEWTVNWVDRIMYPPSVCLQPCIGTVTWVRLGTQILCLSFHMSHELYQHFEPDWEISFKAGMEEEGRSGARNIPCWTGLCSQQTGRGVDVD